VNERYSRDGAYLLVEREHFVARFLTAADDTDLEHLRNEDVTVTLTGGATHGLTLMTPGEIASILRRWAGTGEAAGGAYFSCVDLVVVPRPGLAAMVAAIDGLVRDGGIGGAARTVPAA
jgi:hypothetical protein